MSEDRDSWIVGTVQSILLGAGLDKDALRLALEIADAIEVHDAANTDKGTIPSRQPDSGERKCSCGGVAKLIASETFNGFRCQKCGAERRV
jgi:hypothetical protein